ncbi:MAG: LysR family transcriptional regulator [Microbacteriaceae bacterium]|nr:LysR family transcriptional regulator [Microbacteriaceae bacterium]
MDAEPRPFTIAFVPGVTLTRWTTAWAERFPHIPLAFLPTEAGEQIIVLHEKRADVSFVRLPIEQHELSVIPLYSETPVVVVPKEHPVTLFETVTLADLASEDRVPESLTAADAVELVAAGGGILVIPQSIARLHARKDVVARPVTDAAETRIAIAWLAEWTTPQIEEFVGIVRGRTVHSSRSSQQVATPAPPARKQPPRTDARRKIVKRRKPRQGR